MSEDYVPGICNGFCYTLVKSPGDLKFKFNCDL